MQQIELVEVIPMLFAKKQYFSIFKKGEKLSATWEEEALDEYGFIVKKWWKIPN